MPEPFQSQWIMLPPVPDAKLAETRRLLRYLSVLYALAAMLALGITVVAAWAGLYAAPSRSGTIDRSVLYVIPFSVLLGLGCAAATYGLWTSRWRAVTITVAIISLILIPIGTVVGAVTLLLLFSRAGKRLAELSHAMPRR